MEPDANQSALSHLTRWVNSHPARAGAVAGWLQQAVSLLVAILLIPVVTRYLSAEEAGIWFAFQSLMAALSIVDMGFGFAISRQVAFAMGGGVARATTAEDDFIHLAEGGHALKQLNVVVKVLYFRIAFVAAVIACALFEVIAHFGNLIPLVTLEIRICWYILAFSTVVSIKAAGQIAFVNGMGLVYQTRVLTACQLALAGIGAAISAAAGLGLAWMALSFAVSSLAYLVATTVVLRRLVPPLGQRLNPDFKKDLVKKLSRVALPIGGVNVFGFFVYGVQAPLLGFLLGPSQVAPFYLAQKIASACTMFTMHMALPRLPLFTRMLGENKATEAAGMMLRTIKQVSFVAGTLAMLFYFSSPALARVLLNAEQFVNNSTLLFMAIDMVLLTFTVTWGYFVLASGRNPFVVSTILTGLTSILLSLWFAPQIGIVGLPLATIFAGLIFNYRVNLMEGIRTLANLSNQSSR